VWGWCRYLLLLVGATLAVAQEPAPLRIACTIEAPELPGGLVLVASSLKFERVDVPGYLKVRFDADGAGTATVHRGGHYRVRPLRMAVQSGRRGFGVAREYVLVEPSEFWIPAIGPLPEPRFRLSLPRGPHRLRLKVASRSGQPIPGAKMRVARNASRNAKAVPYGIYESNMEGEAQVADLPAGRYRVTLVDVGPFGVAPQRPVVNGRRRFVSAFDEITVGVSDQRTGGFVVEAAGVLYVNVDTRGMRSPPPVAVWTTFARLAAGPKARPDAPGPGAVYRFPSLAPGRYRVVATLPDGTTMLREAAVHAGAVTPVQLTRSSGRIRSFEFMARWENMPPDLTRTRWYLTALGKKGLPTSVFEAARGGGLKRTYGPDPERGSYLVRYPAQGLARLLDLRAGHVWGVDLTPPKSGFLRRGHRLVRVRVVRDGKPVTDLFVGLQERKRRGAASEKWMRYAATTKEGAVFREVPAGWYRVRFLDKVLGKHVGGSPRPRAISIWRDDIDLVIDLNE